MNAGFYDDTNNLIQLFTLDFQSLAGEMTWAGFSSDTTFSLVKISGDETAMDGLRAGDGISVPEPASLALLGLGLTGFGFSRKKKKS